MFSRPRHPAKVFRPVIAAVRVDVVDNMVLCGLRSMERSCDDAVYLVTGYTHVAVTLAWPPERPGFVEWAPSLPNPRPSKHSTVVSYPILLTAVGANHLFLKDADFS